MAYVQNDDVLRVHMHVVTDQCLHEQHCAMLGHVSVRRCLESLVRSPKFSNQLGLCLDCLVTMVVAR